MDNPARGDQCDAPPALIEGAFDMSGAADLTGQSILVVEDDFFLAWDAATVLQAAGALVLGPCASEEHALEELARGAATAALLDINLGNGPTFTVAAAARNRSIPFVFVTGYEDEVIPSSFDDVPRLQKPAQPDEMIEKFNALLAKKHTK